MRTRAVVVLGAGMAGLMSALALSRDGHRVTLIDRDALAPGDPEDAPEWERRGVTHFLQPHAFLPRGVAELKRGFADVYDRLLAAGADEVDAARKISGERTAADDDLRFLAVRRPLIEWALRRSLVDDGLVAVDGQRAATGLLVDGGHVIGARTDRGDVRAELVVDAMGRRSPARGWMADAGRPLPEPVQGDCGVTYYSRYYRLRPGATLPDGPWYLSPRGDLGYAAYASFPGDNGTFAKLLAVPPADRDLRGLRLDGTFEAALARIPALHAWANPETAEPITRVMPMSSLHNSITIHDRPVAGLVPVGDALCHTDPVLALGLSFSIVHAVALRAALAAHGDAGDAGEAYAAAVTPEAAERFRLADALDDARLRMWTGGGADPAHHDGDYALFTVAAGAVAAMLDADIYRVFLRRIGLLDRTGVLDDDLDMQMRIETRFAEAMSRPRPAPGPSRDELLALIAGGG